MANKDLIEKTLQKGEGVFRLNPNFIPRPFGPLKINTGIDLVTKENVDDALAEAKNISLKDANLKKYGIGQK